MLQKTPDTKIWSETRFSKNVPVYGREFPQNEPKMLFLYKKV